MKPFKERSFWVLFGFVVLVGAFFIGSFVFKNQSSVVPNVDAQMASDFGSSYSAYDVGGMAPQNILFSRELFYSSQSNVLQDSLLPGDVIFESRMHPGSYMFYNALLPADIMFPGNVILGSEGSSSGATKMRTIMTCSGCAVTMSTCDWDCGRTYSFCNTGGIYGSEFTGLTCPGPTGLICGSGSITNLVCTSDFCGGGSSTFTTCSGGMFCGWGVGNTSSTCEVFGCRRTFFLDVGYSGGGGTFFTCSSGADSFCGRPLGDIYGRLTIDFFGGGRTFEASSTPPF